jgi:hypothetical protein
MKSILTAAFVIALTLLSCSRSSNSSVPTVEAPEISFDIAGVRYVHRGEQNYAGYGVTGFKNEGNSTAQTYYQFFGYTNQTNLAIIDVVTPGDTLREKTYRTTETTLTLNNEQYTCSSPDDHLDITITSYENSTINGYFSGKLSTAVTLTPVVLRQDVIENGRLKNIRVRFQ